MTQAGSFITQIKFISELTSEENTISFLVRKKMIFLARSKTESLKKRFKIDGITKINYGVVWNVKVNKGNFESIITELINTQILFNKISHECYRIN